MTEAEIQAICPTLSIKDIRDRSYPAVFYKHVRSTLVHEYHLDDRSSAVPMTARPAAVSYVNVMGNPVAMSSGGSTSIFRGSLRSFAPLV
jgi:hypothetical protein